MPKRRTGRNSIGDFTNPALVAQLTGWLEASGASEIEIISAGGQSLKIVLGATRPARQFASDRDSFDPVSAIDAGSAVKAPVAGYFRDAHPSGVGASPPLRKGRKLKKGAILGFVEIGPVLVPAVLDEDAVVTDIHFQAGDLVGYGARLLITEPSR